MAMLLFFPLLLSVSLFLFSTAFAITPLLTCEKYHWCPIMETAKVQETSNALSIVVLFSSSFSTMFDSQKLCRIRKDLLRRKLWERVLQAILCHLAVSNGSCGFMAAAASGSNLPERSSTFRLSPSSGWCFWSRFQISRGKWFFSHPKIWHDCGEAVDDPGGLLHQVLGGELVQQSRHCHVVATQEHHLALLLRYDQL